MASDYWWLRSPCRNNNGFLDGLESYYVRNYGGTHNDYSGPESDGSDVDNGSYGSPITTNYGGAPSNLSGMTIDKYGSIDINVIDVNSYGSSPWTGASNVAYWVLDNGIVGGGLGSSTPASYGNYSYNIFFRNNLFYQPKQEYNVQSDVWWFRSPWIVGNSDLSWRVYTNGHTDISDNYITYSYGKIRSPHTGSSTGLAYYVGPDGGIYISDMWVVTNSYGVMKYSYVFHGYTPIFTINFSQADYWWFRSPGTRGIYAGNAYYVYPGDVHINDYYVEDISYGRLSPYTRIDGVACLVSPGGLVGSYYDYNWNVSDSYGIYSPDIYQYASTINSYGVQTDGNIDDYSIIDITYSYGMTSV